MSLAFLPDERKSELRRPLEAGSVVYCSSSSSYRVAHCSWRKKNDKYLYKKYNLFSLFLRLATSVKSKRKKERERKRERESKSLWMHTGSWWEISSLQPLARILPRHLNMAAFWGWQLTSAQATKVFSF